MSKLLRYLMCLVLLLAAANVVTAKKKGPEMKKVYIFGFASSFADTVAYMTDIQELDSAYILPHGYLDSRAMYSLQVYGYVNEKLGVENPTCAIFFSDKLKKINKKYEKVKNIYLKDSSVELTMIPHEDFAFKAEEYVETLVTEEVVEEKPKKGEPKGPQGGGEK